MRTVLPFFISSFSLFLITPAAFSAPMDSFDCTFTVQDAANNVIVKNRMSVDVGRKPVLSDTGFQETRSHLSSETQASDGWKYGVNFGYRHATNGIVGYQLGDTSFSVCEPARSPNKKAACGMSGSIVVPSGPNDPYRGWHSVPVVNGLPQVDQGNLFPVVGSFVWGGREVRMTLDCKYKGLIE